jgi:hypothetical protein
MLGSRIAYSHLANCFYTSVFAVHTESCVCLLEEGGAGFWSRLIIDEMFDRQKNYYPERYG